MALSTSTLSLAEEPESITAVTTLHNALVTLRHELELKNDIIRRLRSRLDDEEDPVHSDPILAFVSAEEEQHVDHDEGRRGHRVDVEVHAEHDVRPILRHSSRRRSCTGSQTDISAVDNDNNDNKLSNKKQEGRVWPEWFDGDSTRCLTAVADEFVRLAGKRLVEDQDWKHIWHRAKQSVDLA